MSSHDTPSTPGAPSFFSTMVQADLLASCGNILGQGPFAPPELPGFHATMDPSDSRRGRAAVIHSRGPLAHDSPEPQATSPGLSGSSMTLWTPAVLSHPGGPGRCTCSCLRGRCWLHPSWRDGHPQLV